MRSSIRQLPGPLRANNLDPAPPGLTMPATFGASGDIVGGTATQQGTEPTYNFTVQGTGTRQRIRRADRQTNRGRW